MLAELRTAIMLCMCVLNKRTNHGVHFTLSSIGDHRAYCEAGPFDGWQPFEERRWLIRNFSPSVACGYPVLGKDERPPFPSWPWCDQACGAFFFTYFSAVSRVGLFHASAHKGRVEAPFNKSR